MDLGNSFKILLGGSNEFSSKNQKKGNLFVFFFNLNFRLVAMYPVTPVNLTIVYFFTDYNTYTATYEIKVEKKPTFRFFDLHFELVSVACYACEFNYLLFISLLST
uniref:Uncharacterized protein n=1 Tax=Cacopsylla melanoneura TaxID=428564 RepID=A0A8D8TLT7_9HEMI